MELLLISYLVVYFGSYGILASKSPSIIKDVKALDFTWVLSKSTNQFYLSWLLAGNFVIQTKGTWLRWLLEFCRLYIFILFVALIRELYVIFSTSV